MKKILQLSLPPEIALDEASLQQHLQEKFSQVADNQLFITKLKQSIDARSRNIKVNLEVEVSIGESPTPQLEFAKNYPNVANRPHALIIGAGPAGLFAALRLIELGVKPIVFERGKDVRTRRRDLAALNKEHIVNPESNYCFGEGGAGTYSDGKLYTRSKKRGDIRRILEILVAHGATQQILVEAHPHIGTNKLPNVVADLRESILKAGGEVHFDTKLIDFKIKSDEIVEITTQNQAGIQQDWRVGLGIILATGHSARDIFELLHQKQVAIEAKPFAMGVRIEHLQNFVDECQYHRPDRGLLPAASYSLVAQTYYKNVQRGVFSFCMCPGGFIVPSATNPNEIVVNGMSPSRRDSRFANSGIVVAINEVDWQPYKQFGSLAALQLQKEVEQRAWKMSLLQQKNNSSVTQTAPAQRLNDFVQNKISNRLNETSYQPGLISMDMTEVLPAIIAKPLQEGLKQFGKMMKGYLTNEAQLIGIESRTSSPVRIPRDRATLEHLHLKRLFPCGEGAGYAGGIISAAMDGERCAEAIVGLYQ